MELSLRDVLAPLKVTFRNSGIWAGGDVIGGCFVSGGRD